VATDGSSRRRLEVASDVWCARVAPDGSGLAFLSAGAAPAGGSGAVRLGIWLVDADLAAPAELLLEGVAGASSLCWSPDSRSIAFIGHSDVDGRRANRHVLLLDVESRRVRDLTPDLDRAAGIPVRSDDTRGTGDGALCWSSVTGRIYFELAEGGRGPIAWTTLDGASGRLFEGDEVCLSPALAAKAAWLAVVVTKSGDPGSVQLCDELAPSRRAVGCANRWLSERVVAPTQLVRTVSDDGVTLEGWLTVPRAPRCCGDPTELPPLSVSVHGGPHYAVGWRFSFEAQRLAGRGIAVLSPNPRGSLGYGSDFAELGDGWGGRDWHDVVGVLDAALELGTTDPQRVAIGGASYGGYLAQWAITQTDHFSAAISENGISDLFAQWGSGAERAGDPGDELGARPWDDPSVYVEHSPLRYADRMQTPLLLVHAELDANVPLDQSEQLQAALKLLGRESELVVLEGEGHLVNLLGRPSRRRLRAEVVDAHLDRYLVAESS
jgi:acylaminoacyl-peptidase